MPEEKQTSTFVNAVHVECFYLLYNVINEHHLDFRQELKLLFKKWG